MDEIPGFKLGMEVREGPRVRDVVWLDSPDLGHRSLNQAKRTVVSLQNSPPVEDMENLLKDLRRGDELQRVSCPALKYPQRVLP